MKKLSVFLLMLALVSFVAAPATAQETGTTTGTTYAETDDDGPDMGWLGLIGLAGLLGLKRREPVTHRDTATRTAPGTTR
jgi:MYXO-CTERM domain-containing protein